MNLGTTLLQSSTRNGEMRIGSIATQNIEHDARFAEFEIFLMKR